MRVKTPSQAGAFRLQISNFMSCHRHAARPKQHYFLLACQSGTFFENNAAKPTIKSRFSSDSRLKRALVSAPATVSFCYAMPFSNEIFNKKFQSKRQSSAKKRQSLFSFQSVLHNIRNSKFEICSKLIFLDEKLASHAFKLRCSLTTKKCHLGASYLI